jgi:hypothetical protein
MDKMKEMKRLIASAVNEFQDDRRKWNSQIIHLFPVPHGSMSSGLFQQGVNVMKYMAHIINVLSKDAFQCYFQMLQKWIALGMAAKGNSFEGDSKN